MASLQKKISFICIGAKYLDKKIKNQVDQIQKKNIKKDIK